MTLHDLTPLDIRTSDNATFCQLYRSDGNFLIMGKRDEMLAIANALNNFDSVNQELIQTKEKLLVASSTLETQRGVITNLKESLRLTRVALGRHLNHETYMMALARNMKLEVTRYPDIPKHADELLLLNDPSTS